ncbi:Eco57I restriction-modification methylase domain-containing protein [Winogradskyella endarachnes]|uniref:site-specific DNA-methyltransferase (adenine-specific) n=1 Tax=Winogradskyella endarachnes TaxID=2681965 RepID=A0A6L6U5L8_9FLAO|nr:N-6 DNA methylase [Winogradskyella endarachnes]MUU77503.1 N-6 DNA methylase [Winogradskyella endarachnes]
MALFQTSVIKTYLAQQDNSVVERAYKKYTKYFHNATIQENIKNSKEEQYQAKFLDELFVNVLGYTLNPKPDFNITTEFKNQKGAGKADGAILKEAKAIGVIELKGTNTKDLESIRKQAFDYKANQKGCVYVITSNFEKLRFYINDATEFLEFNLFQLAPEEFALMYLCLQKDNILNNLPLTIKEASLVEEDKITKQFYNDYSVFKRELFRDLVKRNAKRLKQNVIASEARQSHNGDDSTELKALEKNVKLSLFKKSQKLIDRFLFIFFAEDRDLLPPNSTIQILDKWKADIDFGDERPLYNLFKQYFHFLDEGRKGTTSRAEIYAYNGGLFKPDAILDSLEIDDDLLYKHTYKLAKYDFSSQVDVNILGHIFENSLNEIESVNAEIEGGEFDKQKSKRKKDGVFYTPKYITKYIVENTVGKLCQEKKDQLGFKEEAYFEIKKGTHQNTKKQLLEVLDNYRAWLLQITICDPACGSGAFLNQALDFLIKEHRYIDELKAKVLGGGLILSDIENTILENNIYGVDLNEESVEIAKLSLWLRTAQPRRKLNDLSNNIKCGNSLIDSKTVAGDKAFNWQQEFPQIFDKGGFDVIIGNPPYGDYFTPTEKDYLLKKYQKSFSGTFDMYIFFFEVALNILNEEGRLCYITPNTFVDYSQFSGLRSLLKENNNIEQVITLSKVFEDAIVDTTIISLVKNIKQSNTFLGEIFKMKLKSLDDTILSEIDSENLLNEGFIIKSSKGFDVFSLIHKCPFKLSDLVKITQGVTTGGNKAFINRKSYFVDNDIPEKYVKKVLKGKTINRYRVLFDDEYILYSTKTTNPEVQNKISELLEPFEEKLSTKRETKKGTLPWYCLHWAREEEDFNEPKILIRQTASEIVGVLDEENYYPIDTIHTLNLKVNIKDKKTHLSFILGLINSNLFKFLYNWKLDEGGKVYPQVKKVNIEWFPVVDLESTIIDDISIIVLKIQDLYKTQNEIRDKLVRYLCSKFNLDKVSQSLFNWHELDFADFIKELNKAIKKAGGTPLTKKDEFEWLELFEDNKKKAQELQTQITQTEKTIDTMVYDLYGLTQEERDIIENS